MEIKLEEFEFKANNCTFNIEGEVSVYATQEEEEKRDGLVSVDVCDLKVSEAWVHLEGGDPMKLDLENKETMKEILDILGDSKELEKFIEQEI